jgi:oligopeptide/dipeptide ABC transporter ATP-binding protein
VNALVEVTDLRVQVPVGKGLREVVHRVSLAIAAGEAVGLVGESGSGKSMTARTIMRLLPAGTVVEGQVRFDGRDVLAMDADTLRRWRMQDVAMVFQDPRAHINPVRRIGDFLTEGLLAQGSPRASAEARVIELLDAVRVTRPAERLRQYPHQLSGGLLQRVMIAAALTGRPRLLLADEPTTALDVTTQAEVMAILGDLRREFGLALLLITHDLELAAATCTRTAVMYAGSIMETQQSSALHDRPLHPYTAGLVAARPRIDAAPGSLAVIAGQPIAAFEASPGCAFAPRCPHVDARCAPAEPALQHIADGWSACVRSDELFGSSRPGSHDG